MGNLAKAEFHGMTYMMSLIKWGFFTRAVSRVSPHYGKRAARLETERRRRGGL
jgi:hypothetical protein